jgi:hypothetical protein
MPVFLSYSINLASCAGCRTLSLYLVMFECTEGKQTFARADMKGYYAKVQARPPGSNFDREFNKAVKLAYFYEDGANSYLTNTGTTAVEAGFEGKREKRSDAGKKRKPKKKQKA